MTWKNILACCMVVALYVPSWGQAIPDSTLMVDETGQISLLGSFSLGAVDLVSQGGYLIPIPSGSADPWQTLLLNSPEQVTYVSLLNTVSVDGSLTLSTGFDVAKFSSENSDLQLIPDDLAGSSWANVEVVEAPIGFGSIAFVPEPSTGLLLAIGLFGLANLRRQMLR